MKIFIPINFLIIISTHHIAEVEKEEEKGLSEMKVFIVDHIKRTHNPHPSRPPRLPIE